MNPGCLGPWRGQSSGSFESWIPKGPSSSLFPRAVQGTQPMKKGTHLLMERWFLYRRLQRVWSVKFKAPVLLALGQCRT